MSSQIKPIKVWGKSGPNPPKVAIILAELGLPHEIIDVPISDVKTPEYLAINPNGRLPAIHDPNTDITLWESGAIIEYLIQQYDTKHRLSFASGTREAYQAKQWLHFQVSGQGPYYGQVGWFKIYHPEQVPSAIERYVNEMKRVTSVLEGYLAQQKEKYGGGSAGSDGPWLVGNKLSYADIVFVPWQVIVGKFYKKDVFNDDDYPLVKEWLDKMTSRPLVKQVVDPAFSHLKRQE
ncbi:hypothetical protein MMC14_005319 [Varicellaria rhodocarpa]|nr:hypothetical protein [Varicellaria rhodocarpa]